MTIPILSAEKAKETDVQKLYQDLCASPNGLSSEEAVKRLATYGKNQIEEKKHSLFLRFILYFWGPIPWMIEFAAILSAVLHHWSNLIIISVLLLVNGLVGFFEERQAGNAIDALKKRLALKSLVKRNGSWSEIDAADLVVGDIVRLRLGNIIPADVKLTDGSYLSVDQSALTGESLPVSKKQGDIAYSGSIARQGEMEALVIATGQNTFFGKTAKLVESAGAPSHFQHAVLQIGHYLIYISLALAFAIAISQTLRGDPFLDLVQFILVLIIASIPVAMPAVLSVTMALGALKLAKFKAFVTKLESIEEMAGIDVLCSDKTGTLTQNKLELGESATFGGADADSLLLSACLASKQENEDPIDLAVLQGCLKKDALRAFRQVHFTPFDPIAKRTEATVIAPEGNTYYATKGAPQIILDLCKPTQELREQVEQKIEEFGARGFRTLGVATSGDEKQSWQFLGLLTLSDPLREDSKETVQNALQHGIQIKMLTGDNISIAKEIARELDIGNNLCVAKKIQEEKITEYNGFAEVFPEHKYTIVQSLQKQKHIVAMTGDGVNDAPALKQADVGIAVSGATDAARSAASLVLTAPGLSVIIGAIEEARRIFERMNSYSIYRITETIRVMLFMVLCILVYNFYPVTPLMIILLALLNDLPIMTIVYDHALLDPKPVRWKMKRILTISTSLGLIGVIETFLLIFILKSYFHFSLDQLQSLIFLKLSIAGHLTLFVARTKNAFFAPPYPSPILFFAIFATQCCAAVIVGFGLLITAVPWIHILYLWLYCIIWMFIEDGVKNFLYWRERCKEAR